MTPSTSPSRSRFIPIWMAAKPFMEEKGGGGDVMGVLGRADSDIAMWLDT
jgi:hypothetical protein